MNQIDKQTMHSNLQKFKFCRLLTPVASDNQVVLHVKSLSSETFEAPTMTHVVLHVVRINLAKMAAENLKRPSAQYFKTLNLFTSEGFDVSGQIFLAFLIL